MLQRHHVMSRLHGRRLYEDFSVKKIFVTGETGEAFLAPSGDSRIMPSQGGFIAGYNGQIAVDAAHQIITAHRLSTNPADFAALVPLMDQTRTNLGRSPREVSADTGFASEDNLVAMQDRKIKAYLPARVRHGPADPTAGRMLKRAPP
jgi:hypothetical protein